MGHIDTMRLLTTVAIILCPKLPTLGLYQSMHNLIIPFRLKDILAASSIFSKDGRIRLNITRSLILDAIKRLYIASINSIFRDSNCYPKMLSIYYLNINQTKFQQFRAIFKDKGTIKGTYGIHKSIFLNQLSLQVPKDPTKARPIYNNFCN